MNMRISFPSIFMTLPLRKEAPKERPVHERRRPDSFAPASTTAPTRTRAQAAAYKNVDDLQALLKRSVDYMLNRTTNAPDDGPGYYLRRNQKNASLPQRFADAEMIQIYEQFIAGPLREACNARKGELGQSHDHAGFAPRPYTFTYQGKSFTVNLG